MHTTMKRMGRNPDTSCSWSLQRAGRNRLHQLRDWSTSLFCRIHGIMLRSFSPTISIG